MREGLGPVAEYNYWRERDAEVSLLVEQLKQPAVVRILALLEKTGSTSLEVIHSSTSTENTRCESRKPIFKTTTYVFLCSSSYPRWQSESHGVSNLSGGNISWVCLPTDQVAPCFRVLRTIVSGC